MEKSKYKKNPYIKDCDNLSLFLKDLATFKITMGTDGQNLEEGKIVFEKSMVI